MTIVATDMGLFGGSEVHSGIAFWGEVPPPHHDDDEHTYSGHLVHTTEDSSLNNEDSSLQN